MEYETKRNMLCAVAVIGVLMATHHIGAAAQVIGLVFAVVSYGVAVSLYWRTYPRGSTGEGVAMVLLIAGCVLVVAGLLGTVFADRADLLPFSVLLGGLAILVPGGCLTEWDECRLAVRAACMLVIGLAAPALVAAATGLIVTTTDGYTSRYGTPVIVTMSDKCRYWKTQNGKIEGNPDCPGSTWKVGARTVTGDLKVNWSDTTGPGITVRAHAIGTTAVAVTHSTNKEDKSAIGSLGLLGRMPYKWAITIISAILVPGVLVAFVREASAQSGEREQNRTEDADHAGISP